jgi:hypothetical protein
MLVLAGAVTAWGQGPAATHKFKVVILAELSIAKEKKIAGETTFAYSFQQKKGELAVICDGFQVKALEDGKELLDAEFNKDRLFSKEKGQVVADFKPANAPPKVKQMLQDSFGTPVCKIEVDAAGKELKRTITAGEGAKSLIDHGMIANTRFFHVYFPEDQDRWTSANEVSVGNGQFAKGVLSYEKVKDPKAKDRVTVKVSGTLKADQLGAAPLQMKAQYVFKGEQVYDRKVKEWVWGKLSADVSIDSFKDKEKVASGSGTMTVTLQMLPGK